MKIAAYCRVSTDKDEQLDSLENQKAFFLEYAKKYNHKLVHLYADEGISGTRMKKRTEFLRLMQDAKLGNFEAVIVKDISRFARNTVDFLQSIRELKSLGINTIFVTANMESLGESEFVLTIFGAMAQEESANLSKRVKFGKRINAEKGRVPQRIFGYDRIDNYTLRINEEEAKIVRQIYRMYIEEGLGCRSISLKLNAEGKKTKFQCDWNPRGVRRVLVNPIYYGHYINHKYEIADYLTGKQVRISQDEHFHHSRPEWAIITREMFQKAQDQMEARRKQYNTGKPFVEARHSTKYIFSTLIKCEHCGRSFCRKNYHYKSTRVYWKCTTNDHFTAERCDNRIKLNEDDLLAQIRSYLSCLIKDKDEFIRTIISELLAKIPAQSDPNTKEILEKKRAHLLVKRERYQEMYINEIISIKELKDKNKLIEDNIAEIDDALDECDRNELIKDKAESAAKQYTREIESFLNMENITNLCMRKIIDRIVVNKNGNVNIMLKRVTII